MKRLITLMLALVILIMPSAAVISNAEMVNLSESESNIVVTKYRARSSGLVDMSFLDLQKNSCTIDYIFVNQYCTGSLSQTLQRKSGTSWIDVAEGYSTYAYSGSASGKISVSGLPNGTYRVRTYVYMIIQGAEYRDTVYTAQTSLY